MFPSLQFIAIWMKSGITVYDDPNRAPTGITFVLVNGRIAAQDGRIAGSTSGTVLRDGINTC